MTTVVEAQRAGAVQLISLSRPEKLNAFNGAMYDALTEALIAARRDPTVAVVVLTGRGRAFSAGADLTEMGGAGAASTHGFAGLVDTLIDYTKPVIAAVNGPAVGIGATLCGLVDLVFVAASASIRCPFAALGLNPEAGSSLTFPMQMGPQRAAWLLYTAEPMSADECVASGFALAVLPDEGFVDAVLARAAKIAAQARNTLRETKQLLMLPRKEQLRAVVAAESAALTRTVGSAENREAIAAFLAKRPPDFSGMH
jgi:enoyl-CoA hydratase/carnithine racemase